MLNTHIIENMIKHNKYVEYTYYRKHIIENMIKHNKYVEYTYYRKHD